ncbi:MAG: sigma-70 family RNA polymerase sigma factor [Fuerstiella sp.]
MAETYRLYRQGLFSLALSITGCAQLAEDAVQTAFECLCRSEASPNGSVVSYVFAAVRNAATDVVRSNRRATKVRESIFNEAAHNKESLTTPVDGLLVRERDQLLRVAIDGLDDGDREVIVMKIYGELTFDEIGTVLGQPGKTVGTRYRRALSKLEEKLRGQL